MPVTFEQVVRDIKTGKSTQIYFSSKSLWWTHLEADAIQATEQGHVYKIAVARQEGRAGLYTATGEQTDPIGAPIKIFPKPALWMSRSKKFQRSYGKHGLCAFMKTHHQNCSDFFSNTWDAYNQRIDIERNAEQNKTD
jgi:hypothetical protein